MKPTPCCPNSSAARPQPKERKNMKKPSASDHDSTSHSSPSRKYPSKVYYVETVDQGRRRDDEDLGRLFLFGISLCDVLISTSCSTLANAHRLFSTYVVASLLILVALLVLSSLGLIRSALLVVQSLPSLTEDLANLACDRVLVETEGIVLHRRSSIPKLMPGFSSRTFSRCSLAKNM